MRSLACAVLFLLALTGAAFAASGESLPAESVPSCAEIRVSEAPRSNLPIQLADSCRSNCSSRRGYCVSSCRDSQCRAICNDIYQSCVSSCR